VRLDKYRFETSYEWYEPKTYEYTKKLIFENENPDKGTYKNLLLDLRSIIPHQSTYWSLSDIETNSGWSN